MCKTNNSHFKKFPASKHILKHVHPTNEYRHFPNMAVRSKGFIIRRDVLVCWVPWTSPPTPGLSVGFAPEHSAAAPGGPRRHPIIISLAKYVRTVFISPQNRFEFRSLDAATGGTGRASSSSSSHGHYHNHPMG